MSAMGRELTFKVIPPNRKILTNTDVDTLGDELTRPDAEIFNRAGHFRFGDSSAYHSE